MKRLSVLFLAGLAFVFNMVNMSGLGDAYHTETYTRWILAVFSLSLFLKRDRVALPVERNDWLWSIYLVLVVVLSSLLGGSLRDGVAFLSCFLITYIFGKFSLDTRSMQFIGCMLLVGSYALLMLYLKTDLISGWNGNAIAMISFFSFMCYMASVMFVHDWRKRITSIFFVVLFIYLVEQTAARSSTICAILALLICLLPNRVGEWLRSRGFRRVVVHYALIFAVAVTLLNDTQLYLALDQWSVDAFEKPLMNGRENSWPYAFELFSRSWLIGVGSFRQNSWHNWALSLLVAYGTAGYILWTRFVQRILNIGEKYLHDPYVKGLTVSFLLILVQQSAELGLIGSVNIHLIPYMILGLILSRVRYLQEFRQYEMTPAL